MKSAWLVRWATHAVDEEAIFQRHGIKSKIIDVLSSRKTFEQVMEHVENLYKVFLLSISEKIYLEHYSLGRKRRRDFFGGPVPVFTHYGSELYAKLDASLRKDFNSPESNGLREAWYKHPKYIDMGHNPSIEAKKVFNLYLKGDGVEQVLIWEEPMADGSRRDISYRFLV